MNDTLLCFAKAPKKEKRRLVEVHPKLRASCSAPVNERLSKGQCPVHEVLTDVYISHAILERYYDT